MHLQIEGHMYKNLVYNSVIPSAIAYQNKLIANVTGLKEIYGAAHKGFTEAQLSMIEEIGEHISALKKATDALTDVQNKADKIKDTAKMATAYCNDVKPYFDTIRDHADELEKLIEDQLWPLTKYSELLFIK